MTRKEIFIAAHAIAKTKKSTLNVAYRIALSIALKEVYNSAKQPKKNMENVTTLNIVELIGEKKLNQDFSTYQQFREGEIKFGNYNFRTWNGTVYGKGTDDSPYHIYLAKNKVEFYGQEAQTLKEIAVQKTAFESILKTELLPSYKLEWFLRKITELKYNTDQFTQAAINVEDLQLISNIKIEKIVMSEEEVYIFIYFQFEDKKWVNAISVSSNSSYSKEDSLELLEEINKEIGR